MQVRTAWFRRTAAGLVLGFLVTAVPAASFASDPAQNKVLMTRFVDEVLNKGDMAVFDEITSPDFVEHEALGPGVPMNRDGCKQMFMACRAAFPDLKVKINTMMAEGDKVMVYMTWTGTNKGEYMGMPATNKPVSFDCVDIVRFEDGKAVEHWGVSDNMGMMQQMHPEMMEMHNDMPMSKDMKGKSGD